MPDGQKVSRSRLALPIEVIWGAPGGASLAGGPGRALAASRSARQPSRRPGGYGVGRARRRSGGPHPPHGRHQATIGQDRTAAPLSASGWTEPPPLVWSEVDRTGAPAGLVDQNPTPTAPARTAPADHRTRAGAVGTAPPRDRAGHHPLIDTDRIGTALAATGERWGCAARVEGARGREEGPERGAQPRRRPPHHQVVDNAGCERSCRSAPVLRRMWRRSQPSTVLYMRGPVLRRRRRQGSDGAGR